MPHNFGGFSAYSDSSIPTKEIANDGGLPGSPFYAGDAHYDEKEDESLIREMVKPSALEDGGDGSGVMRRHHTDRLPDLDRKFAGDSMMIPEGNNSGVSEDSTGPTGKKFTEHLHSRESNGKFEPSTKRDQEEK